MFVDEVFQVAHGRDELHMVHAPIEEYVGQYALHREATIGEHCNNNNNKVESLK